MVEVFQAYCDESWNSDRSFFAVAGLFGTEADWQNIEQPWRDLMEGRIFHAADCESRGGDFRNASHQETLRLYKSATQILAKSNLLGYGVGLSLPEYRTAFPDAREQEEYFFALSYVFTHFATAAHLSIPSGQVEFILDQGKQFNNACVVYSYFRTFQELPGRRCLAETLRTSSREGVRIQAADLLARETMKHLDNQFGTVRRTRASFDSLQQSKRIRFLFLVGDYFSDLCSKPLRMQTSQSTMADYHDWRKENGFEDSVDKRMKYQLLLDAKDRAAGRTPALLWD